MLISSLLRDPATFLRSLLIALPGILLALSVHESAHGYVALHCGDPTARDLGRITLNPAKHFDPIGFLCMLLIGMGWARPVPVNPKNFRHDRWDDLRVSLAGIAANLLLFLVSFALLTAITYAALSRLPVAEGIEAAFYGGSADSGAFLLKYSGDTLFCCDNGILPSKELFRFSSGYYVYLSEAGRMTFENTVIAPALGGIVAILYEIIVSCMFTNLSLAVFNLIPLPPLDGYHVLNDLILRQDTFAKAKTVRITSTVLVALILIGNFKPEWDVISIAINAVRTFACDSLTTLSHALAGWNGII